MEFVCCLGTMKTLKQFLMTANRIPLLYFGSSLGSYLLDLDISQRFCFQFNGLTSSITDNQRLQDVRSRKLWNKRQLRFLSEIFLLRLKVMKLKNCSSKQCGTLKVERWAEWGFFHDRNLTLKYHINNSSAFCFDMQLFWKFHHLTYLIEKIGLKLNVELIKGKQPFFYNKTKYIT